MFKNGQELDFPISVSIMEILAKIVGVEGRLQKFQNMYKVPYVDINNNVNQDGYLELTLIEMAEKIIEYILPVPEKYSQEENIFLAKVHNL